MQETLVRSLGWEDLLDKEMAVFLPGKFHGQRSLAGYSPWGQKESNMTELEHVHTHTRTPTHSVLSLTGVFIYLFFYLCVFHLLAVYYFANGFSCGHVWM